MSFIDGLRHRLRVWTRRAEYDRALEDEMRFHLELDSTQQSREGSSDAHAAARRRFGNATYLREETRQAAGLGGLDAIRGDAKYLLRSLRRSPGFAIVAILTLALGIGTTTAVLSVVDHVLVHALPFREAGRLAVCSNAMIGEAFDAIVSDRRGLATRSRYAARVRGRLVRSGRRRVDRHRREDEIGWAQGSSIPCFFRCFAVRPALGRVLSSEDQRDGAAPAVVLAYSLWQQRFGGDPSIVGRRIDIDSVPTTIVGVLPAGAQYPGFATLWRPLSQFRHKEILTRRGLHVDSRTIARFRPGVDSAARGGDDGDDRCAAGVGVSE